MQTYQLEVNDNISDKILWLLNSFKHDVKIKKIENTDFDELNHIKSSVKTALNEVEFAKKNNKKLDSAWDLLDEL